MLKPKHILLASHGTDGARAAERLAFSLCAPRTTLSHLIVVPDFWKGMMGDDWLNNAATRDTYGSYVEAELEGDIRREVKRLQRLATRRRIRYLPEIVFGKPEDCLRQRLARGGIGLVVLGTLRPRGKTGLRSRMLTDTLLRALRVPLLVRPAHMTDAPSPPVASRDAAWVTLPLPQSPDALSALCRDIEAVFRANPYLYFSVWRQTGPASYHAEFENQSNQQNVAVDLELAPGPGPGFTVHYANGLKKRTVFAIEPDAAGGSRLTITDDYEALPEAERSARANEADKSLHAWGAALRAYFLRLKRWSWLPGWRWYIRRVWVPMKPSARRIVWLFYLITVVEFFFFLFVLLIYLVEQQNK